MNTLTGFILLHRQIIQWEWYQTPNTFRLFVHCLLMANFSDGRFEGKEIKRGQFVTSIDHLSKETKLSVKEVRTALNHLIGTGELASESCNRYRIITVVQYDKYQSEGKQKGSQGASEGQAEGKPGAGKGQQYNNKNKGTSLSDNDGTNNIFSLSDGEVAERIKEDQEIEAAALSVGLTISPSAMDRARDLTFRYGLANVLDAINASVDVPKWSYVEGVLRKMKQDEAEAKTDLADHEDSIKQSLMMRGEWDDEYQCSKDKAERFRQMGLSPDEAMDEMERERRKRERAFNEIARRAGRGAG